MANSIRRARLARRLIGALAFSLAGAAHAQPDRSAINGSSSGLRAEKLQPDERIVLDGSLSHPAWQRATAYERFSENQPHNGAVPPQRTEVRMLVDDRAIYIGVMAFDDRARDIVAVPVRHDSISSAQDFVTAYVDPIGHKSSAQFFRINAAGSMADGIHTAADDNEDSAPDFDWDAAVQRTPEGWSAVLRIPFATLRFAEPEPGVTPLPWRFMLARQLPREQFHLLLSADLPRGAPSFIDRLQTLDGVTLPGDHRFLTLRPGLTLRQTRERAGQAPSTNKRRAEASLDLKWRPRAELLIDATLNPDFSQVALDVPQLVGNTRFALSLPEKRPFFFESADLLRSPTDALYTRSITQPRGGLRASWRSAGWSGTALVADDRGGGLVLLPGPYGTDDVDQPGSRVLIARGQMRGSPQGWSLGGLLASRQYEDERGANHVAGADVEGTLGDGWRLRAQLLGSRTTAHAVSGVLRRGSALDGYRAYARVQRAGSESESSVTLGEISNGFRHDTGFVNQSGVRQGELNHTWKWQRVGPFNNFELYVQAGETRDRALGQLVQRTSHIGFWGSAARNLEWWFEVYPRSTVRTQPQAPPVVERYASSGLQLTPTAWWPLIETSLSLGELADAEANQSRPGARWNLSARLRPAPNLEFEPSLATAWLYRRVGAGRELAYRETAAQGLAILHLNAQQNLRLILQRSSLDRRSEPGVDADRGTQRSASLTWQWRRSAGTQVFVGVTHARESGPGAFRSTEAFVKLQLDVAELRGLW